MASKGYATVDTPGYRLLYNLLDADWLTTCSRECFLIDSTELQVCSLYTARCLVCLDRISDVGRKVVKTFAWENARQVSRTSYTAMRPPLCRHGGLWMNSTCSAYSRLNLHCSNSYLSTLCAFVANDWYHYSRHRGWIPILHLVHRSATRSRPTNSRTISWRHLPTGARLTDADGLLNASFA